MTYYRADELRRSWEWGWSIVSKGGDPPPLLHLSGATMGPVWGSSDKEKTPKMMKGVENIYEDMWKVELVSLEKKGLRWDHPRGWSQLLLRGAQHQDKEQWS